MRTQGINSGLVESQIFERLQASSAPGSAPRPEPNLESPPKTDRPGDNPSAAWSRGLPDSEEQKKAAEEISEKIREIVRSYQRDLHFELHKDTGLMYVQVRDVENGEVLRELPMEQILDTLARIDKAVGLLLDGEA